jgi:hypothetical protein
MGFWHADAAHATFDEVGGAGHGAVSADADDGIEAAFSDVFRGRDW